MQVLRDGRAQRSRGRVLLRQTLQTGRFDEPGEEPIAKDLTLGTENSDRIKLTWTRRPSSCRLSS